MNHGREDPGTAARPSSSASRLGLGTASFGSRVDRKQALRLLHTGFEAGIRYVDTARSYGYGEAEFAVGDFLAGRREHVTVATKVGILPPRRSAALSAAKSVARALAFLAPAARRRLRRHAGNMLQAGAFDLSSMTASLHASLRALRTDYVDVLLLHDCTADDLSRPEIGDFLARVQRDGTVRRVGLATTPEVTRFALEHFASLCAVVQLPAIAASQQGSSGRQSFHPDAQVVLHSVFAPLVDLRSRLLGDPAAARRWTEQLGSDVTHPEVLARLALQHALQLRPGSVVLFNSTSHDHIRANVNAGKHPASDRQLQTFANLLTEEQIQPSHG